jgi:hypothetical protein
MANNIVHVLNDKGHRGAYINLFSSVLDFTPVIEPLGVNNFFLFLRAEKVLFATMGLNKTFKWFFIISLSRAILLKPTCLLLVNPSSYLDDLQLNNIKVMKLFLRLWKHIYKQTVLSIIPYYLDERSSIYTKDYIYDPQMWDMYCNEYSNLADADLDYVKGQVAQNNKPIIIFLGKFMESKGLKEFVRFVEANKNDAQFIVAGKVPVKNIVYAEQLKKLGVNVINERLEESKFIAFYEVADFVWCYYEPDYDQTSGIFGRAIQFGVIPIVRRDSIISRVAKNENLPCIILKLESKNHDNKMPDFPRKKDRSKNAYFTKIRDESLNKIKACLYI